MSSGPTHLRDGWTASGDLVVQLSGAPVHRSVHLGPHLLASQTRHQVLQKLEILNSIEYVPELSMVPILGVFTDLLKYISWKLLQLVIEKRGELLSVQILWLRQQKLFCSNYASLDVPSHMLLGLLSASMTEIFIGEGRRHLQQSVPSQVWKVPPLESRSARRTGC